MSYNGIGLHTPRGSGTNGYIQTNKASRISIGRYSYRQQSEAKKVRDEKLFSATNITDRYVDERIVEHERKRQIESKCFDLRERLEDESVDDAEIEKQVSELRVKLVADMHQKTKEDIKSNVSQLITEAKAQENKKLQDALKEFPTKKGKGGKGKRSPSKGNEGEESVQRGRRREGDEEQDYDNRYKSNDERRWKGDEEKYYSDRYSNDDSRRSQRRFENTNAGYEERYPRRSERGLRRWNSNREGKWDENSWEEREEKEGDEDKRRDISERESLSTGRSGGRDNYNNRSRRRSPNISRDREDSPDRYPRRGDSPRRHYSTSRSKSPENKRRFSSPHRSRRFSKRSRSRSIGNRRRSSPPSHKPREPHSSASKANLEPLGKRKE